eukprot:1272513-Pleurochrysis_carterae.AAC.1
MRVCARLKPDEPRAVKGLRLRVVLEDDPVVVVQVVDAGLRAGDVGRALRKARARLLRTRRSDHHPSSISNCRGQGGVRQRC